MKMLRAIIIDDESNQRENIRLILEKHCAGVDVIAEGASAMEGISLLHKLSPDVMFLDVQMPGGTGLELLKTLDNLETKVVLVTAHSNHMQEAFKVRVFDYLIKPIDIHEMLDTVKRLQEIKSKETEGTRKVGLPSSTGYIYLEKEDIEYISANGSYSEVQCTSGQKLMISKNLKYLESILNDDQFIRVHRSSIINVRHVREFSRSEGGIVILTSGHETQVSSDKRALLLDRLEQL
jgi:two-component system LytT family response regulator